MMDSQGPDAHEPRRPRLPVSQTPVASPKGGSCGLFPAFCDGGRELEIEVRTSLVACAFRSHGTEAQNQHFSGEWSSLEGGDPVLWLEMSGGRPN